MTKNQKILLGLAVAGAAILLLMKPKKARPSVIEQPPVVELSCAEKKAKWETLNALVNSAAFKTMPIPEQTAKVNELSAAYQQLCK